MRHVEWLSKHTACIWCVECSQVSQSLQWVLLLMKVLCCICQVRCLSQDISTPTASHKSLHDSFEIFYRQRHTNLCTRQALVSMRDMTVCWCLRACAACWGSSGPTALPSRTCSPGRRLITSALSHTDRIEYDAALPEIKALPQQDQTTDTQGGLTDLSSHSTRHG